MTAPRAKILNPSKPKSPLPKERRPDMTVHSIIKYAERDLTPPPAVPTAPLDFLLDHEYGRSGLLKDRSIRVW